MQKILIIFNHQPYDGSDICWNALRLAETLLKNGNELRIFLMNDSVDLAREKCEPPSTYEYDLKQMLKDLIAKNVCVKVCGTCIARCGLYKNEPYYEGAEKSTMADLADWVRDSDKVLTF